MIKLLLVTQGGIILKKCIVMPDSFKGSISSMDACHIIRDEILVHQPNCIVDLIPVADGGEGTVDCFLEALGGEKITLTVSGPFGESVEAYYARCGDIAIIEMAQAAGLPQAEGRLNPAKATTYGVGELIRHAVEQGVSEIYLGLGGSCTNDAGVGMARALGGLFFRGEEVFVPSADTLHQITRYDISAVQEQLKGCKITAMCDIDNPLFGEQGAAYIFAPQKGADEAMVRLLDENLRAIGALMGDVPEIPGAGAAGGMGAGVVAFLNGTLKPGIQTVLDLVSFEKRLADTDVVFTGEGKIDAQSLRGKVVIGIARRAKKVGVPVVALVGDIGEGVEGAYEEGVAAIFSINQVAVPFSQARLRSKRDLRQTVENLMRFQLI